MTVQELNHIMATGKIVALTEAIVEALGSAGEYLKINNSVPTKSAIDAAEAELDNIAGLMAALRTVVVTEMENK
jgi:hypothetical protein